ncbi:hypothetical protein DD237_006673 [Peronospora effusa]|uniref:Endonuclease/exonuclease/phosphatase domain-containing protein n=1 Tax=Peronospora effusa TaxID=542832 RepID=A0A3R7Y6T5_9STRA|nr:hypothetical protein DD237_006673 [Peronospora effusa]
MELVLRLLPNYAGFSTDTGPNMTELESSNYVYLRLNESVDIFYVDLTTALSRLPQRDTTIILGDFNANNWSTSRT